ncbi:MAG TPA: cytochrome c oxidase subunit II [Kofleriaceae bacterium]|nr:cytochrome c oxidase subunit II [Kofleriaceae bacterium]
MKPFVRHAITITATAVLSTVLAIGVFDSSSASAQSPPTPAPAPAPAAGAAPGAAPPVNPPTPGEGSSAGSAATPAEQPAPAAGAAPAEPPRKPTIFPVDCKTAKVSLIVKGTPSGFELQCTSKSLDQCSQRHAFMMGTAARFELAGDGIQPYPEDQKKLPELAALRLAAGAPTCIQFEATGQFKFRGQSRPNEATLTVKAWYELLADRPIDEDGNFWMPKAVNVEADSTDQMFYAVLGLSIFFFVAIAAAVVYLVVKYRHRPGHRAEPSAAHNDALEITWTVIPTIICVFLFYFGWRTYVKVVTPPVKAVEINTLAWRWSWQFTHANGVKDKDLHVPVNAPVRLVMTSKDVLHAFYAPAMRVKQDIIPRRYTYVWFFATKPGTYRLTCAEYCGTDHSQMGITAEGRRAVVVVHEPGKYEQYLADEYARSNQLPPAELGAKVFEKNCTACHTIDGTIKVGPSFKGTFGTMVQMADGKSVKMDETYIRESVLNPTAKTRAGFPAGQMSSFEGQLKEKEIEGIIAFIKSLAK